MTTGRVPHPHPNGPNEQRGTQHRAIQVARRRFPGSIPTPGLAGWRQLPPESPGAIFVGPRPPAMVPIFTADTYLPCSSRRLNLYEMDARHFDFWNDPVTVASGQYLHGANTHAGTEGEREGENQDAFYDPSRVRLNASGEAVFSDEDELLAYVRHVTDSVLNGMVDVQPRLLNRPRRRAHPQLIYGFAPIASATPPPIVFGGPDSRAHPIEGTISIVAEIPINPGAANRPVGDQGQGAGRENGHRNNEMEEPPFD